jgi:glyoxylase-like metal-dependent hydrolase (beta-lactamase superfamily II)
MKLHLVSAGHYWTDAGAFFGVLPYFIWHDKVATDERQRLQMNLNLLLMQTDGRNILVDTGIGNRLNKRRKEIYDPSPFELPLSLDALGLKCTDITDVILTHLHFDHAGGIVSSLDGEDYLTFPGAEFHIQKSEWHMAQNPDKLNKAAYQFDHQLSLLDREGRLNFLDGDAEIAPGVMVRHTGGHTVGMQIVEVLNEGTPYIYAGDIIPTRFHLPLAITSSYDVSRQDSYEAKQKIYERLTSGNGYLLLDHDTQDWQLPISEILPFISH